MNKQEFKAKAKKSIDDLFSKIDALEEKRRELNSEFNREYEKELKKLKEKKLDLQSKYDDLENASEDKWDDVKISFSKASESFKKGFLDLLSIFK
ncbi:MAG: putative nucleic acid-binding Zn-ribbon protein [Chitinophagales bacterium]|jgi:predicted  nucleic acid-binding Zn-ribbon protein